TIRTLPRAPAAPATDGGRRRTASALCDFLGAQEDDILRRDVLVEAAIGRLHALDPVDDVLPGGDLAEDAIAPALRARPFMVEEGVVGDIDEELRGRRIGVGRAGHRERVAHVHEPGPALLLYLDGDRLSVDRR